MCLSTLDKVKSCENGIAYKVVFISPPDENIWRSVVYKGGYVVGEVNVDYKDIMLVCECEDKLYKCGFHLFANLEDARKWQWKDSVVEVAFENVTATGMQNCDRQDETGFEAKVIVARKIKVLRILS